MVTQIKISEFNEEELAKAEQEYQLKFAEIKKRKEELANASLVEIQKIMTTKKISTQKMIDYLTNFLDKENILIVYIYKNEKGEEKTFTFKENQRGRNPFLKDLKDKKITKEQALLFAANANGVVYINKILEEINSMTDEEFNKKYEAIESNLLELQSFLDSNLNTLSPSQKTKIETRIKELTPPEPTKTPKPG